MSQNNSWNKRKTCSHIDYEDFTEEEYEVCESLLSLKGDTQDQEEHEESPTKEYKVSEALLSLETSQEKKKHKLNEADHNAIKGCKKILITNIHEEVQNLDVMNDGNLPPVLGLRNYISGCGMPFEKQLTKSDLRVDQNRLLLNKNHVETSFLPLLREDESIKEGIEVIAYNMDGNMFTMTFKIWADKYYVLMGGWKAFFQAHTLQIQDYVKVWMFRHSETNKLNQQAMFCS
ncbi:DNA-binding barrel domain superfamily [Sesbania bispinosa]|nr:DNA-binding barrel domain superfamily [Sesbania bispinosa]